MDFVLHFVLLCHSWLFQLGATPKRWAEKCRKGLERQKERGGRETKQAEPLTKNPLE